MIDEDSPRCTFDVHVLGDRTLPSLIKWTWHNLIGLFVCLTQPWLYDFLFNTKEHFVRNEFIYFFRAGIGLHF